MNERKCKRNMEWREDGEYGRPKDHNIRILLEHETGCCPMSPSLTFLATMLSSSETV